MTVIEYTRLTKKTLTTVDNIATDLSPQIYKAKVIKTTFFLYHYAQKICIM